MTVWEPDQNDIAKVSNSSNYLLVLLQAGVQDVQSDLDAAVMDSQAANIIGKMLMSYINWANDESTVLYNGDGGDKHNEIYYNGERDKGMEKDSQGTSAIMQQFTTSSQNYEMLMKNGATTNAHSADNMQQQSQMSLQGSDITQQEDNMSSLLGSPD